MPRDPLKSLESLVTERKALAEKERRLIEGLARALDGTGFALTRVAASDGHVRSARPARMVREVRRVLRCPTCSRRFALAMHLARHVAASHMKKAPRTKGSRGKAKKRVR
jgi:uncharacterized C2H2 Zn-finger protein